MAGTVAVIAIGSIALSWRGAQHASAPQEAALSPSAFLGNLSDDNFARAEPSREFQFPADHGPHGDFRTEWWYLTGHLNDDRGQRLALQLVLMRVGLTAQQQRRSSRWAATEMLAGLFSVSDPAGNRLHTDHRASRAALGLAGAKAQPMHVWLDDWHLQQTAAAERGLDLAIRVASDEVALALQLRNLKSLIDASDIRGQRSQAFAPFHFYVQPRLRAEGTLRFREQQSPVEGTVSMEHAWGELPVPGGPIALDRFMLHLDDGRDLFCVRTHRVDGSGKPETTGLLISQDGRPRVLTSPEVDLEPTQYWVSKRTGARYPIRWALRVQTHGINLQLLPHWKNQEGVGWAPFWASAVRLRGTSPTIALTGDGFVQLNGYDDS
jgi:predicted secreted hydrolase